MGYQARPALWSLLIIGVVFQIAYTFIRLPQISGLWQRDGIGGGMKLLFYQLCINAMIGAFFYGIGFGVGLLAK